MQEIEKSERAQSAEDAVKALQSQGLLYQMIDEYKGNVIATLIVPVDNQAEAESAPYISWYYFVKQEEQLVGLAEWLQERNLTLQDSDYRLLDEEDLK